MNTPTDIPQSIKTAYRLLNTGQSESFRKGLTDPWLPAIQCDALFAVNNVAAKNLESALARFERHGDWDDLYTYLDELARFAEIKVKAVEKRGLVRKLGVEDVVRNRNMIVFGSSQLRLTGKISSAQFEVHQLLHEISEYLLIKDTVENGTGHQKLDAVIKHLVETKAPDFFSRGYISDLFVCDRMRLFEDAGTARYIRSRRDYLSTMIIEEGDYVERDPDNYELLKVAG